MMTLTSQTLEKLKNRWLSQQLPIARVLRPGLSGNEITRAMEPTGLTLPSEAQLWWGWHDGVSVAGDAEFGPDFSFMSLRQAIDW